MSETETQPAKRATRARKPSPHPRPDGSELDERVGTAVASEVEFISFPDGREYRCDAGEIVERVR